MGICIFWQRMRDSNPRKRSQSPVCYRYTNPLSHGQSLLYAQCRKSQALFSKLYIFFIFVRCLLYPLSLGLFFPGERQSLEHMVLYIMECFFLAFVPEHGQKIGQLLTGLGIHEGFHRTALKILQRRAVGILLDRKSVV